MLSSTPLRPFALPSFRFFILIMSSLVLATLLFSLSVHSGLVSGHALGGHAMPGDMEETIRTEANKLTAVLNAQGITLHSFRNCFSTHPQCTSIWGLQPMCAKAVLALKESSGCPELVIVGGTEHGHGDEGEYTHANGWKLDLRKSSPDDCLSARIYSQTKEFPTTGAGTYHIVGQDGIYLYDHHSHWDLLCCPPSNTDCIKSHTHNA